MGLKREKGISKNKEMKKGKPNRKSISLPEKRALKKEAPKLKIS